MRRVLWVSVVVGMMGCGGSGSETPPPIEPTPPRNRAVSPEEATVPAATGEAPTAGSETVPTEPPPEE